MESPDGYLAEAAGVLGEDDATQHENIACEGCYMERVLGVGGENQQSHMMPGGCLYHDSDDAGSEGMPDDREYALESPVPADEEAEPALGESADGVARTRTRREAGAKWDVDTEDEDFSSDGVACSDASCEGGCLVVNDAEDEDVEPIDPLGRNEIGLCRAREASPSRVEPAEARRAPQAASTDTTPTKRAPAGEDVLQTWKTMVSSSLMLAEPALSLHECRKRIPANIMSRSPKRARVQPDHSVAA
jgi:hypothetical protein